MKTNRAITIIHIVCWLIFAIPLLFLVDIEDDKRTELMFRWLGFTLTSIVAFYVIYSFIIPYFLVRKRYYWFACSFLLFMGIYPLLLTYLRPFIRYASDQNLQMTYWGKEFETRYLVNLGYTIIIVVIGAMGRFTFDWFRHMQIQSELKNQNLNSELALLKSQLNPHFLFNTLNNIHTLVYKKSDNADKAVLKLSHLMRYVLYESNEDKVPLTKEIEYLNNYIELEKLRMSTPEQVEFTIKGSYNSENIAPMILVPFIENAFKHSNKNKNDNFIRILLSVKDDKLLFSCSNTLNDIDDNKNGTGGIGLKNVQRRLELLYPKKYNLEIHQTEHTYTIQLNLNLD